MNLITLLRQGFIERPYPLLAISILSGISSAFLISIINLAAASVAGNSMNWKLAVLYVLCLCIDYLSTRYIMDRSAVSVENLINHIRRQLVEKIRHTELATLNKYGTATIYARITQDASMLANVSTFLLSGIQSAVSIIFTLMYIAYISPFSFGMIMIGLAGGLLYYMTHAGYLGEMIKATSAKQTMFFEKLDNILQGFKEIKINRLKNENVYANYVAVSEDLKEHRIETGKLFNVTLIFCEILSYIMLGCILFVIPKFHAEHAEIIIKVVASVLFLMGPLDAIIFSLPPLASANTAAGNILQLEAQLEEEMKKLGEQAPDPNAPAAYLALPFESRIQAKGLSYCYPANNGAGAGFQVGPVDLTIEKGELIFITGGNGSGKSTFLSLITGLYKPSSGMIVLNTGEDNRGIPVNWQNYQQYQNLFTTIFSDYHLFDRLFGVEGEIDPEKVNAVLKSLELPPDKVAYRNGAFTSVNLSSGQKKRLALATTLLEDKAIYVFDEVAADLDPAFRDKFYYEILQELKGRGKTVLVVSHDQQYWMVPDRLLNFQDGHVKELTKAEVKSLVSMAMSDRNSTNA